jgi:hypothetical protein
MLPKVKLLSKRTDSNLHRNVIKELALPTRSAYAIRKSRITAIYSYRRRLIDYSNRPSAARLANFDRGDSDNAFLTPVGTHDFITRMSETHVQHFLVGSINLCATRLLLRQVANYTADEHRNVFRSSSKVDKTAVQFSSALNCAGKFLQNFPI